MSTYISDREIYECNDINELKRKQIDCATGDLAYFTNLCKLKGENNISNYFIPAINHILDRLDFSNIIISPRQLYNSTAFRLNILHNLLFKKDQIIILNTKSDLYSNTCDTIINMIELPKDMYLYHDHELQLYYDKEYDCLVIHNRITNSKLIKYKEGMELKEDFKCNHYIEEDISNSKNIDYKAIKDKADTVNIRYNILNDTYDKLLKEQLFNKFVVIPSSIFNEYNHSYPYHTKSYYVNMYNRLNKDDDKFMNDVLHMKDGYLTDIAQDLYTIYQRCQHAKSKDYDMSVLDNLICKIKDLRFKPEDAKLFRR